MAKYVYNVLRKRFYSEDNSLINESPLSIGYSDLIPFSTMAKAENYVQERIKVAESIKDEPNYTIYYENPLDVFCDDICKVCKVYAQQKFNKFHIREGYVIIKQIVS